MNILLITLDQFRGDCLSSAGHPLVQTPNLDALAARRRRASPATTARPRRAAPGSGLPLHGHLPDEQPGGDQRHTARRPLRQRGPRRPAGRLPPDPVRLHRPGHRPPPGRPGPTTPGSSDYEEVLPGFDVELDLRGAMTALGRLAAGPRPRGRRRRSRRRWPPSRSGRPSTAMSAFLTERADRVARAPGRALVRPPQLPAPPPAVRRGRRVVRPLRPRRRRACRSPPTPATRSTSAPCATESRPPRTRRGCGEMRAQYYGMISEVDDQLGRLWAALRRSRGVGRHVRRRHGRSRRPARRPRAHREDRAGSRRATTSSASCATPGAAEAHGTVVDRFTENVDVFPTLCEAMGIEIPAQADGLPLTPFLDGEEPPWWRDGGPLGVRLAGPLHRPRRAGRLAVGPPARAPPPGRAAAPRTGPTCSSATAPGSAST